MYAHLYMCMCVFFIFYGKKETVRSTVQSWAPGGRETDLKAEAVAQDWTVRHKCNKRENF